jgi:hypothetical protein
MKQAMLCLCALALMAFGAISAQAADVTGAWTAQLTSPNGDSIQLSFDFKQDGSTLTGTVQGPQGDPIAISDGKIDGNKLSFTVAINGMTITHEGTVNDAGDEIEMTTKSDQADFPHGAMTLKRAKASGTPAPQDSSAKPQI